jgi:SAM-dependent methyltransferase
VNGVELYFLGQKLTAIAANAIPADSPMYRITPGARLILADVTRYPGTSASEIAERTGLQSGQVSLLVSELADLVFLEPDGERITAVRGLPVRQDAAPAIDAALADALRSSDAGQVREVTDLLESLDRRLGTAVLLRTAGDFDMAYRGTPPWEIGRPQPAMAELADTGAFRGQVLDVGCGTGEHALLAAGLGLPATGIDSSPTAIEIARRKAAERNLPVRFEVHDALDLMALGERFDTVIDSALFHVFSDDERVRYAGSLRQVIQPGGRYFMLCFSDRQPPGSGPRRVSREEIEATFADGWRIDAIEPATLEVRIDPAGVRAWRTSITRV